MPDNKKPDQQKNDELAILKENYNQQKNKQIYYDDFDKYSEITGRQRDDSNHTQPKPNR